MITALIHPRLDRLAMDVLRAAAVGANGAVEAGRWTRDDWQPLTLAMRAKKCTPFLGAGAAAGILPLGRDIATAWATRYGYPFADVGNLARVAQFVAVTKGGMVPKLALAEEFKSNGTPDFGDANEIHRALADLQLPVYLTTNYDAFMTMALTQAGRAPQREVCRWFEAGSVQPERQQPRLTATQEQPLVFHMHGVIERDQTMVLTEDDYLDFLMALSEQEDLIPPRVQEALSYSCVLFLGYSLDDLNFKVVFRRFANYMRRGEGARHVAVQLPPASSAAEAGRQQAYLEEHLKNQKVKVYWGSCADFARELRSNWP